MLKDRGRVDGGDLVDGLDPFLVQQERITELQTEVAQLREALVLRQLYGVVTGVLAVRYEISPERAWQFLVRLSQQTNLKVQIVARVIHGRCFDRLAPEDEAFAAQLDAHMCGQLEAMRPATATRRIHGDPR